MASDAILQTRTSRAGFFRIISARSRFEIVRTCTAFDRRSVAPSMSMSIPTVSTSVVRSDGNAACCAPAVAAGAANART